MKSRPLAALSLAALLSFAPLTPALAQDAPTTGVTQEDGKSWFSLTFDITGEEESFLQHIASWFQRDDEPQEKAPISTPVSHHKDKHKDGPGNSENAPGHNKDKWWHKDKDKPRPTPTTPAPTTPAPTPTDPAPTPTDPVVTAEVQAILDGHNEFREAEGLDPLVLSDAMSTVAQDWTDSMAADGELVHNPDYTEQLPEGWTAVAENIAMNSATGVQSAEQMVEQWIESPGHRDNMMDDFTHVGIGFATVDGESYGTVNFGAYAESPDGEATTPEPDPTTPAPEPTTPPATGSGTTGGTGGAFTNRTFQSFSSGGTTSQYHIYAEGRTGTPGLLFWADGSGGSGFDRPDSSYLIGGTTGMNAIAKARNMILVVPVAPAPGCDGTDNCWYDDAGARKAKWSSDLMTEVKKQYPVRLDRVAIGGYSSGAQWTTNFFMPVHGEAQSVDLFMPFAYGGPPRVTASWTDAYKKATVGVWNTGTNDPAIGNARAGFAEYQKRGFTKLEWEPSNSTHSRSGEFGPFAAQNIDQHLAK